MAASLKVVKQSRTWKLKDSTGSEDLENLFDSGKAPSTKPVSCNKYWTLYLCLFGVFALFLFGIVVGFYLRADPKVFNDCARNIRRKDGFDKERLQAVHNNIMYYMSGDRVAKYNRDLLSLGKPLTDEEWEKSTAKYIEKEFRKFEFDQIEVEENQVVITSPDPTRPNTLELLTLDGSQRSQNGTGFKVSRQSTQKWTLTTDDNNSQSFVAFSPSGNVSGPLHYGYEGTLIDFLQAQRNNISVNGSVVLLQLGGIPVPEKVRNAQRFGAVGVLLFCNHDYNASYHGDCDPENTFASAADFLAIDDEQYPRIPVQTVSSVVALSILKKITGTSRQVVSLAYFKDVKTYRNDSARFVVRLEVNMVRMPRTVYNVIGTIYGSDEIDREIIVGAGNRLWNNQSKESTNPSLLLELANSLNYIKNTQGWRPRRTLKLAFWGGKALSNTGLISHLKNRKHILAEQGVGYIDLDLSNIGQKHLRVETSSSLVSLVTKAALMVPDPENPDISLAESWPELSHDWYLTNQYPVHNYRKASWHPFLREIGTTSIVVKNMQYNEKVLGQFISGESTHHFQYHLATARVVSRIILQLADNPKLPFDVDFSLQLTVKSVNDSLNKLKQFMDFPKYVVESLVDAINKLNTVSHSFTLKSSSRMCMTSLQLRSLNDVVMKLDRFFVDKLPTHKFKDYLLVSDKVTGTLSVLLDAVNSHLLTGNSDTVYKTFTVLSHSLDQAFTEMSTLHNEL